MIRYYKIVIGPTWWSFYASDENRARKVADRIRRLIWPRYVERVLTRHRGSMAHATVCGWAETRPEYCLRSARVDDAGVIRSTEGYTVHFDTTIDPSPDPYEEP